VRRAHPCPRASERGAFIGKSELTLPMPLLAAASLRAAFSPRSIYALKGDRFSMECGDLSPLLSWLL
jgi:hypothetical protein